MRNNQAGIALPWCMVGAELGNQIGTINQMTNSHCWGTAMMQRLHHGGNALIEGALVVIGWQAHDDQRSCLPLQYHPERGECYDMRTQGLLGTGR
jgi:hypothetical protein